jgi:TM2 domain-containing membrane protein YozV
MNTPPRDVGVAYILLIMAGLFGAHRYYAGRQSSAVTMTILTCTVVGIVVTAVWVVVDLFLTAGLVAEYNNPNGGAHKVRHDPAAWQQNSK